MHKEKKDNQYGAMALAQARKIKNMVTQIESTTIGSLLIEINNLQDSVKNIIDANIEFSSSIKTLENQVIELTNSLNQLLSNYAVHTHPYVNIYMNDTADGTGALVSENNTTGVINGS